MGRAPYEPVSRVLRRTSDGLFANGSYTRLVPEPRFEMVIAHVFDVTGRPLIVSGSCSPTDLRQGDMVEVLCGGYVVAATRAYVELHSRPGTASLALPDVAASDVEPGYVLRALGQH